MKELYNIGDNYVLEYQRIDTQYPDQWFDIYHGWTLEQCNAFIKKSIKRGVTINRYRTVKMTKEVL